MAWNTKGEHHEAEYHLGRNCKRFRSAEKLFISAGKNHSCQKFSNAYVTCPSLLEGAALPSRSAFVKTSSWTGNGTIDFLLPLFRFT